MSDVAPAEFAAWSLAWAEEFDGPPKRDQKINPLEGGKQNEANYKV